MAAVDRIGFLHTGAVVIDPVRSLFAQHVPTVTAVNYLDDRIVADLGDPDRHDSVRDRVIGLVETAKAAGIDTVMLTCSSISEYAAEASAATGVRVLRIDEAMADDAVAAGSRITVIATLPTTCAPTSRLIDERARLAGKEVQLTSIVVEGAFAAVAAGDRATHDALVGAAIERAATQADVIVLAQASMAGAADAVSVSVPVLSSIAPGIRRLAALLADDAAR